MTAMSNPHRYCPCTIYHDNRLPLFATSDFLSLYAECRYKTRCAQFQPLYSVRLACFRLTVIIVSHFRQYVTCGWQGHQIMTWLGTGAHSFGVYLFSHHLNQRPSQSVVKPAIKPAMEKLFQLCSHHLNRQPSSPHFSRSAANAI